MEIADVFKKNFTLRARANGKVVRGTITDKKYDINRQIWEVQVSGNYDGKDYSKIFTINEVMEAHENNSILKIG